MGDSDKRFGWTEDGLDAKDRIQKNDLKERAGKENQHTRNLRERVQEDEHTRINNYSEGYCYGCSKVDKVISTLIYMCGECMEKRGTEGLMCLLTKNTIMNYVTYTQDGNLMMYGKSTVQCVTLVCVDYIKFTMLIVKKGVEKMLLMKL